jgi:hypothetical protein
MFRVCLALAWLGLLASLCAEEKLAPKNVSEPVRTTPEELTKPRSRNDFLILPLRIYRLRSPSFSAADCQLSDRDFARILPKVNRVWAVAGIYFGLESIQEEPADVAAFARVHRTLRLLQPSREIAADAVEHASTDWQASRASGLFKALIPRDTRDFNGFRVYYIQDFDVNGIYYGQREAIVKATARLRPVPGGIDEPIPRVTSHELGHGLGLPHRQDHVNLMASGTTGTSFIASEVEIARKLANNVPGVVPYSQIQAIMAKSTDSAEQMRLASWKSGVEEFALAP